MAKKTEKMAKEAKKTSRRKGEEGYWERDTSEATEAAQKVCAVFDTAEEFTACADKYFDECDARGILYGEAGLCLALAKGNAKGKPVSLKTLRNWFDGLSCTYLQDAVQMAYLRIQEQIETDPRYQEKGGMATKGIFLLKQSRFGGYQDRTETKNDSTVKIVFGKGMDPSDFQ